VEDSYSWRAEDGRWTTARAVAQSTTSPQPVASIDFFAATSGGTFVVDLGDAFVPGTYVLEAKANFDDGTALKLTPIEASTPRFNVDLHGVPVPPRGWFQEVLVKRDGSPVGAFYFT